MKKEYLIKVSYTTSNSIEDDTEYLVANGGHIDYELIRGSKGQVKLKWGPLYTYSQDRSSPQVAEHVRYKLVTSYSPYARLDSVCAAKRNVDVFHIMQSVDGTTEYTL
jgi:hypothetical protein